MPLTEELRAPQQLDEGFGEEETDRQVEQGGQAEGEGETFHAADREDEQDDGGEDRDHVRDQDCGSGLDPARGEGGSETSPVSDLVTYSLEVDDEGVRRDTDRDDGSSNRWEVQGESHRFTEHHHGGIGRQRGDAEGTDHDDPQPAVVDQAVQDHEPEADGASEETDPELFAAERGGNRLHLGRLEVQRQRTELQDVGEFGGGLCCEVARDLGLAVVDGALNARRGLHHTVEHHRELVAGSLLGHHRGGHLAERAGSCLVELKGDHVGDLSLRDSGVSPDDALTHDGRGAKEVFRLARRVAGHRRLVETRFHLVGALERAERLGVLCRRFVLQHLIDTQDFARFARLRGGGGQAGEAGIGCLLPHLTGVQHGTEG